MMEDKKDDTVRISGSVPSNTTKQPLNICIPYDENLSTSSKIINNQENQKFSDPAELSCNSEVYCSKEYCRLGCVCSSLNAGKVSSSFCTNYADCMFNCTCNKKKNTGNYFLRPRSDYDKFSYLDNELPLKRKKGFSMNKRPQKTIKTEKCRKSDAGESIMPQELYEKIGTPGISKPKACELRMSKIQNRRTKLKNLTVKNVSGKKKIVYPKKKSSEKKIKHRSAKILPSIEKLYRKKKSAKVKLQNNGTINKPQLSHNSQLNTIIVKDSPRKCIPTDLVQMKIKDFFPERKLPVFDNNNFSKKNINDGLGEVLDTSDEDQEWFEYVEEMIEEEIEIDPWELNFAFVWCAIHFKFECNCMALALFTKNSNYLPLRGKESLKQVSVYLHENLHKAIKHPFNTKNHCARTQGSLINYRIRNSSPLFKAKRKMEIQNYIVSSTNGLIKNDWFKRNP